MLTNGPAASIVESLLPLKSLMSTSRPYFLPSMALASAVLALLLVFGCLAMGNATVKHATVATLWDFSVQVSEGRVSVFVRRYQKGAVLNWPANGLHAEAGWRRWPGLNLSLAATTTHAPTFDDWSLELPAWITLPLLLITPLVWCKVRNPKKVPGFAVENGRATLSECLATSKTPVGCTSRQSSSSASACSDR